ncbi:MAG: hypothetical protein NC489_28035, partial [Ruminococcus flavefaciens]|nr:hypothetical protein [Ruminococcus flavefaciens]
MSVLLTEQALNAQVAVLGSMLIDPETVGPMLHQLTADDFTDVRYRHIFQAVKRLQSQGTLPDALTVNDALGGNYRDILAQIIEVTPTSANAEEYAAICRRTALQTHLSELGEQLANAGGLDDAQALVDRINALNCEKPGVRITGLRQCYEEFLTRHADGKKPPYLTWGIPALDGLTLVSNSDAHSPARLGREANLLNTGRTYPELIRAIRTGAGFGGTIEFFPEEGKYHLDGHRDCGVCLTPQETLERGGLCPVCGKRLTVGVAHRVELLADRPAGFRPPNA